jgi:hypothetical protein
MRLIGCMAVRNEAWILGLTLRAALMWCDEVVVLLHACTDASEEIAVEIGEETQRVAVLTEPLESWDEMRHRQRMLDFAREYEKATHIAIVDADEILTGDLLGYENTGVCCKGAEIQSGRCCIRGAVEATPKGSCLQLPMYQLRGSLDRYHANGIWGSRWLSVAFADDPRLSWSGDKFHDREPRYPDGSKLKAYQPIKHGQGGSFHLWGVSERRLRARHALYKVTERLRWPDRPTRDIELMYNDWRSPEDNAQHYPEMKRYHEPWTYADVPVEWWQPYAGDDLLDLVANIRCDDRELWQEAEVRRLVAQYGAETFRGLDLFGIA